MPAPFLVLGLQLLDFQAVNDFLDQHVQVGDVQVGPDGAEGPADVVRDEVEDLFGQGGQPADAQVAADHDDGDVDAGEQVRQVVVELAQLQVAVAQLLVDG